MPSPDLSDAEIDVLLEKLDLEAKVRLLSGASVWTTAPVPEVGLRSMTVSDGPIGVRGGTDTELEPSAALPSASGMAASWDEDLLARIGALLAAEAVRKRVDVVLGPTVNLHRSPLGGRHFECFSEDPLLSGRLATAYVRGLQDRGIGACPKHYVANDAETDRMTVDVRVDERTLRELYLAPFEAVVTDAAPWTVMAAYNGVNGAPMTENDLLAEPLKGEWGFDGVVVSDWGALHDGEPAARAALDLAMPGPDEQWSQPLVEAVRAGHVPEAAIDEKVCRILRLAARAGALDGVGRAAAPSAPGRLEDAAPLAREAASAATVLLRNDGLLPLAVEGLRRVAVVGPGARDARALGGGSASVPLPYVVPPVTGIAAALAGRAEVVSAPGAALSDTLRPARADELAGPGGTTRVTVRWLDATGAVVAGQTAGTAVVVRLQDAVPEGAVAMEVATRFTPDVDGEWRLGVVGFGTGELVVDGESRARGEVHQEVFDVHEVFQAAPQHTAVLPLRAGEGVDVCVRYAWSPGAVLLRGGLVVGPPRLPAAEELARAVHLARGADVAVVVVGTSEDVESEGSDRTSLALPGRQDELVRAVAAVNPRTVVVVNAGAPVELPWRDDVAAVLVSWFPGMEFGNALADVLLGTVEPGGRLPTTWPAATADAPVLSTTPTGGRLDYTEGLHVGHRAYLRAGTEPAHWFGEGLGYTTWAYEGLEVPPHADGSGFAVVVRVRNTGARRGRHVVQVYAARPGSAVERPVRWLAGFTVVSADPGESIEVPVAVHPRALRHWDVEAHRWAVEPGDLVLATGPHAGDLPVTETVRLVPAAGEAAA
ncbi:glycoside hydrolase family 3 C-terminal domain-containing protein [Geodermatophilus amargosae]|uniref:glycoside hydrolase family 3 C-terminal domain-containing protein n=1 Tax=Geodermatophilus amargosae TaxID=1296565 RepID=UPI0034DF13F5